MHMPSAWTPSGASFLRAVCALLVLVAGPAAAQDKLLISQVEVRGAEYIVLKNPGSTTVSLADVYVTDATFRTGSQFYYHLPNAALAIGGGDFNDFVARFPDTATVAPGQELSISVTGSNAFFAAYGVDPHYELHEDLVSGSPGPADGVPDMVPARSGSILGNVARPPNLTDAGEVVILFHWDGASDLVVDLDYVVWGDKDEAVDKTGVAIDGPDGDAATSTYQPETPIANQEVTDFGSPANTYVRVDDSEGTQAASGGNGVGGRDETSENLSVTFAVQEASPPGVFVPDVTPPTLVAVAGTAGTNSVRVTFSEEVGAGATTTANYAVYPSSSPGNRLTLTGATLAGTIVTLGTAAPLAEFTTYVVEVSDVADAAGNVIVAGSSRQFTTGAVGGGSASKLLITQVEVRGDEYVVIKNPNAFPVDLTNYYITDATFGTEQLYYNLPDPSLAIGGGGFNDFVARFPAGARVGPQEEITMAIGPTGSAGFQTRYGFLPTFELFEDAATPDAVTDMVPARPGSIVGDVTRLPGLTNSGEVVVLFFWNGQSDLVVDIDYVVWGDKAEASDKTNQSRDGPDADTTPTMYLPDTPIANQEALPENPFGTFIRVDETEGTQRTTGGNGVDGRDETSENVTVTFTADTDGVPPVSGFRVVEAVGLPGATRVTLTFSREVGAGGNVPGNYEVYPTGSPTSLIPVVGASVSGSTVTLTLGDPLLADASYTVRVSNVQDVVGNTIAPASTVTFLAQEERGALFVPAATLIKDFGEEMKVEVNLDTEQGMAAVCRIFDLQGRLVKVLMDEHFGSSGQFQRDLFWDARDETFELVRAGTYICHLMVTDYSGDVKRYEAPIVVAARLE
jgi:hypothetical protein